MRRRTKDRLRGWVIATATGCIAAPQAHAYLDPGSGSMLLQILLGGFAAAGVAGKLYWHRIRARFGANEQEEDEPGDDGERPERE